ncbi:MAG: EFR1 family ferrodoxin [Desulfobacterales bacterium]|nr:EFR1 family ferrodoxin [Desulfobacterales bacterium]
MDNRRTFIKKCVLGYTSITMVGWTSCSNAMQKHVPMKNKAPKKVLVLWFSQTGHTERIGRLIGHEWQKAGLSVEIGEYRDINKSSLSYYDIIAIGTPVNYMDVPINLKQWLNDIPRIDGVAIVAFVTFGGSGDGQHNTAYSLLELMADKGGVPVGIATFGNMSTFAPTWSLGNEKRTLSYKHLPNETTYKQVRKFSEEILRKISSGQPVKFEKEFGMETLMKIIPQIWFTKLMITNHIIDKNACIKCGTCIHKCPASAIDLEKQSVDDERCIACLGCINNCPANAVKMNFFGKPVYGFNEFLKRKQIKIVEPT